MHVSTGTITICFIAKYQINYIHFIGCVNGGYTKASVNFKKT